MPCQRDGLNDRKALQMTIQQIMQAVYDRGIKTCLTCRGNGFYTLVDDDSCDVVACDCTEPIEI